MMSDNNTIYNYKTFLNVSNISSQQKWNSSDVLNKNINIKNVKFNL